LLLFCHNHNRNIATSTALKSSLISGALSKHDRWSDILITVKIGYRT